MISSSIGPRDQLLDLLSYPIVALSMGYRQVKSEPMMFVMLSYSWLIPRAYTIISFGSDQCYHRVHMMVEVQWYGNSDELLLSPSVAFCLPPWIMLNINLVLETCVSISSCFVHEAYVWMKVVTFPNSCAYDASCRHEFEEDCFVSLESSQISHAHVRSILWSGDLQPSFHMCPEHTKPLIDLFKEKKFLHKS